ncbi:helix-turn-helix domain-containing protein [Lacticaseibacillus mingshuiensis]|uniref:helix-turn-helix domain-containing protein n=1 Tax=Lacticaseibacillus mingshuiensis TaxID=2799574 RepID=UPI0019511A3E|nr:helix-turn-helix transcriptional regulator [Lacticaseibacillus mingshuiensis]
MALGKIGLQETPDGWPTFHRDLTLLYPDGALTTAYQDLWRAVQATDWRSLTEKPRIPCPPSNAAIDLNELRLNKKMSVATLCHGVGLSKATYWRLVRQETAQLPLSTVVRVFDWLHVRADELQSLYTEPIFIHERSFDGIGRVNEVLVAHISPRAQQHALLDLIAEYEAKAQAVPTPANHLVVTIAQFENAKLRVDYPQAQTLALSVLHQVLGIEDWNHFMNLALLVVADLLPIAPVVAAYTHVIKQVDAQAQLDDRLREILYMSLINASGLAENAAMQAEALTLLARATADKTTVMSRSIAKFTGLARARIASSSTAEADFLALKTTLVRFDPFLGHAVNISFDEMWTNLLPAD